MAKEMTDWFPGSVKPAYPGMYKRMYKRRPSFDIELWSRWDGKVWYAGYISQRLAEKTSILSYSQDGMFWRGLAKPPLTRWFSGDVKPVRPGVYERRGGTYSRWTGQSWLFSEGCAHWAARARRRSAIQHTDWRGLRVDAGS